MNTKESILLCSERHELITIWLLRNFVLFFMLFSVPWMAPDGLHIDSNYQWNKVEPMKKFFENRIKTSATINHLSREKRTAMKIPTKNCLHSTEWGKNGSHTEINWLPANTVHRFRNERARALAFTSTTINNKLRWKRRSKRTPSQNPL